MLAENTMVLITMNIILYIGDYMKIGLCLSGGGIKGAAHIGAIKALEEENIKFDSISGTSSGSIVATLLACGYSSEEIYYLFKKYIKKIKYIDGSNMLKIIYGVIVKRKLIIDGLNSGKIIESIMNEVCNQKKIYNINDLSKELLIPAVDSSSGKVYIFNSCKLNKEDTEEKYIPNISIGKAVRASCSYPVVFSPCTYEDKKLLDGGLKENIPWRELKNIGCNKIISIGFKNKNRKKCCENVVNIAERSFELILEELHRHEINRIDFLHTIELKNVSLLQTEKMEEIYEEGYKQTKRKMKEIIEYIHN